MPESTDLARELGAALGDAFAVQRPLGEGGFAVVFLVRDLTLKRDLAVKVLSPDVITSHSMLERFRREAETVAQLSHPNIVPVHFIGEREGLLWLAMQCIDGGSIADRMAREGRLPVDDAVRVAAEVASALAHAHKRGVIHRDIKPANVLIDGDSGRALVTDFGIARTVDANTLTATGVMLGTPAYLSPEQITGDAVDHRVDIYALGVMLYEMLAGRLPFEGATPTAAMMKRLGGPAQPVSAARPEVSAQLSAVVATCLAAEPSERFQEMGDVVTALRGGAVPIAKSRASRRPRAIRIVTRAAALAVLGVAGIVGWRFAAARQARGATAQHDGASRASASLASDPSPHLVAIPAGSYVIGSDSGPAESRPRHTEHVDAFAIERTEVTVGAYERFIIATHAAAPWTGAPPDSSLPATGIPWGDAANYCAWAHPHGRLPTEFEWEAAARGVDGRAYPYGNAASVAAANTASARRAGPAPVGSFVRSATPEGLQDMSGNVWEWTSSPMRSYPGAPAMPDTMSEYRVIRGGAFNTSDSNSTAWTRGYLKISSTAAELPYTGFRCVVGA